MYCHTHLLNILCDGDDKIVDLEVDLQLPKEDAEYLVKELHCSFVKLLDDGSNSNSEQVWVSYQDEEQGGTKE
jgi:hypothetical protein